MQYFFCNDNSVLGMNDLYSGNNFFQAAWKFKLENKKMNRLESL